MKSFTGSNGIAFSVCGTTAIGPIGITMIVAPSGAALFTASAAMRPAAPGRFSTITGCPIVSLSLSATTRAMRSAVPPGANPTRIRTGLSILSCADTPGPNAQRPTQAAASSSERTAEEAIIETSFGSGRSTPEGSTATASIREPPPATAARPEDASA